MKTDNLETIEQLHEFLTGTQSVWFAIESDSKSVYKWVRDTLVKHRYVALKKADKGVVVRYLMKITSYSRQQITRLIRQYRKTGSLVRRHSAQNGFKARFTKADISLLAKLDELHDTLSGPATKKLCERAYRVFGELEYERLASISVAHLYNLRKSTAYSKQRWHYEKTKPKVSRVGTRQKPRPNGMPGYLRIDTVHQGDYDKEKGVYHINAVDEVTQFEVVYSVQKISESHLIPVLDEMMSAFPFVLKGFHSDNGSEYINRHVAKMLKKLLIEFTKSRPRHSNDNALAECKNGAIIRKVYGYSHIPQHWATELNNFNRAHLTPYINYHRPCFFPEVFIDDKGKERKKYRYDSLKTPYDKLKSLENSEQYLKEGFSFQILDAIALEITDSEAAKRLQEARTLLFDAIDEQKNAA